MYTIEPNYQSLRSQLSAAQKLGLMQHLHNLGWGRGPGLDNVEEVQIAEKEGILSISGYGQTTVIEISQIKPIQVVSPWSDPEEPRKGVSCVRGTAEELKEVLELMGEFDKLPEILIDGVPHQCVAQPVDFVLDTLDDPDSNYPYGIDLVYRLISGQLFQQVKKREHHLEYLGPIH